MTIKIYKLDIIAMIFNSHIICHILHEKVTFIVHHWNVIRCDLNIAELALLKIAVGHESWYDLLTSFDRSQLNVINTCVLSPTYNTTYKSSFLHLECQVHYFDSVQIEYLCTYTFSYVKSGLEISVLIVSINKFHFPSAFTF